MMPLRSHHHAGYPFYGPFTTAIGQDPPPLVPAQSPDATNSQSILADLVAAQQRGATPQELAAIQADFEEAKRIEDDPAPSAQDSLIQLLRAQNRGASAAVTGPLQAKFEAARIREQGVTLSAKTLFQALSDARRLNQPPQTISGLEAQLAVALEREIATERRIAVDAPTAFLRWQMAVVSGQPPQIVDAIEGIFKSLQGPTAPFDSTFVNRAFVQAVSQRYPDAVLQRLKDMQRPLLAQDLGRIQATAPRLSTDQLRQAWQASISAGSAPQVVAALKQLFDQASARDATAAAAAAAAAQPAREGTTAPPATTTTEAASTAEEKPSLVTQFLTLAALTAPAWGALLLARR